MRTWWVSIGAALLVTASCSGKGDLDAGEQTGSARSHGDDPDGGPTAKPLTPEPSLPDAAPTGTGGSGGAPPLPPAEDAGSPTTPPPDGPCWFEFLGPWVRCAESWDSWGDVSSEQRFETRTECAAGCLADPACTAFHDYNWSIPGFGCLTHRGTCTPSTGIGYEEDGAREYRKVCGENPPPDAIFAFDDEPGIVPEPSSGCRYVVIPDAQACENDVPHTEAQITGATLNECLLACDARSDCSAVKDWWYGGPTEFECALHLGACDAPVNSTSADGYKRFFRKVCDGDTP